MKITKYTHACVRLEHEGRVLVIDLGTWSEPSALTGADAVRVGETFTAAGFRVRAAGGRHAPIYGGRPDCANLGYLVDGTLYHPGDSLHVPAEPVETLLVPLQAPWLKTAEVIDFVRAVAPERAFGIHDGQINERGLASVNGWLGQETRHRYRWLAPLENG
ncbi:MBL fold metallo-hydrolase [Nonomuraea sp. NPDC048882]|uniref:MBL fold metallo-hydrolase n=1 Tax=Nonomuraea sp. NPDC048882 TaxID=3154347 RepID=UPI0033F30423